MVGHRVDLDLEPLAGREVLQGVADVVGGLGDLGPVRGGGGGGWPAEWAVSGGKRFSQVSDQQGPEQAEIFTNVV